MVQLSRLGLAARRFAVQPETTGLPLLVVLLAILILALVLEQGNLGLFLGNLLGELGVEILVSLGMCE